MTRLPEWLHQRANLTPARLALVAGAERLTFAELDQAIAERASSLATLGVRSGDRVAVLAQNCRHFVELVHALPRLGAVLVPLNTRLTVDELAYQIDDAKPRILIHDEPNASKALQLAAPCANLPLAPSSTSPSTQRRSLDLDSPHSILYTSGTTGRPKGAILTNGNHWWSAVGSVLNLGLREYDRWLAVLPLFHVGGLSILLRSAIYGIPIVLHDSFDAAAANRAIDEDGVTIVSVVAPMLQRMLDQRGDRRYAAHFRCALLGGGPAPRPLLELAAERGVPVVQTYGLTETASQVATLAPEDARRKLGSAGKPLMPTELRIVDDEILVRGPTVSPGYLTAPTVDADGWFHTGDLGRLDDDGYLYVLDRRDDLIVTGGENVYPAEVEAALLAHPEVSEAAVFGLPDAEWGQNVNAAVVAIGTTEVELREFLRGRLAAYKVPRAIRFVDSLPRNAAGKLLRKSFAAPASAPSPPRETPTR